MNSRALVAMSAPVLLALASAAGAGTKTTTFQVSANVLKNCLVTANDLAFGDYVPSEGDISGQTTVDVRCTSGVDYTVALDFGVNGGTDAARFMSDGSQSLEYNLYRNAGETEVWGDGSGSSFTVGGTGGGMGVANAIDVYGVLPDSTANQAVFDGTYTDTITVTVTY